MKERPILFSGEMVRALLDGRKTQTRRVMKPQPWYGSQVPGGPHFIFPPSSGQRFDAVPSTISNCYAFVGEQQKQIAALCPYGRPGDRLWVKETTRKTEDCGRYAFSHYVVDGAPTVAGAWPWKRPQLNSIYCPRGLSRITLEITDVRVERVQDISAADTTVEGCGACHYVEGMTCHCTDGLVYIPSVRRWTVAGNSWAGESLHGPRANFAQLWDSINAKRGHGWDTNPWVWAITFRRIEQ